jgi:hypothetical protein
MIRKYKDTSLLKGKIILELGSGTGFVLFSITVLISGWWGISFSG